MILGPHGKLISDGKHSYCQGPFSSWVVPDTYLLTLRHFGAKVTQRISWKESISEETHKRSPILAEEKTRKWSTHLEVIGLVPAFLFILRAQLWWQEKIPVRSVQIEKLLLVVLSTVKETRVDPASNLNFQLFALSLSRAPYGDFASAMMQ
jgi:hypothetical protein